MYVVSYLDVEIIWDEVIHVILKSLVLNDQ